MSLEKLLSNKKLVKYQPMKEQISELLDLIERDISDSKIPALSLDRRFISLYSAAQTLATIVLYINGYRTRGQGHHHTTFEAAKILLPSEYERSGIVSEAEAKSLAKKVIYFKKVVGKLI